MLGLFSLITFNILVVMSDLQNIDIINRILKNQINVHIFQTEKHLLFMILQYDSLRNKTLEKSLTTIHIEMTYVPDSITTY